MALEIRMPQLSDTMHSGKILRWNKSEGDTVERGEILAEVETDKANLEIESFHRGTLLKIAAPAGTEAQVGRLIAYIGEAGEIIAPAPEAQAAVEESPQAEAPEPPAAAAAAQASQEQAESRIKASPLARKIAADHGIDLSRVAGSGPGGRIVREDVEKLIGASAPPCVPAPEAKPGPAAALPAGVPGKLAPFSKMRAAIARRMQESASQAPHFYTTAAIDMEAAQALRAVLKKKPEFKGIGINHLIIKAAACALSRQPQINCAARGDRIFVPDQFNIGVVTAVEDGLLIPVIKEADRLTLKELVVQARAAVERAKAGKPNSTDLSGGTFTISNMGMYEIENFTAIISPGQGAILTVSTIMEQPAVRKGQLAAAPVMRVTLAADHRVIDGVMSARWLACLKEALETPALLLL